MDIIGLIQALDVTDVTSFCVETGKLWQFIGYVVLVLQIAIPILIILLGTIDLAKAVMAGEDKQIKEAQKMFIKRVIYGVIVFFVIVLIKAVFSLVDGQDGTDVTGNNCIKCVTHPNSGCQVS